jgi:glycosyltransferase involved in cell wall biosynthesis
LLATSIARTNLAWHATLVVATSPYTATELQRHADLPASHVRVVPLGVDLATFEQPDAAAVARLRRTLGLTGRKVMLYVGRCVEHKRIDLMIETLAALASDQPDLALLIVGDTGRTVEIREHVAALRAQAEALGVADRVLFTGRVPSVAPYFALAELYLQASQHEGFGVPLVEAMAAGVPLVASASGAMPWLVGQDETAAGLLFAPGDLIDLTAQVRRALTEPGLAATLAERGAQRATGFGLAAFNARALDVVRTALTLAGPQGDTESSATDPLLDAADIAFRDYRVRSDIPLVGPAIEWARSNATTHVKEAYFDRTVEQQVNYNRRLAQEVVRLRTRVRDLAAQVAEVEATAAQEAK